MYKNILIAVSLLFLGFTTQSNSQNSKNINIPVLNFETLKPYLYTDSEEIHIVNFWAMWCAPCVKELPILEVYQKKHPNLKITLVSLDFSDDLETKVKPFLKRKGIISNVVLLDDPDANSWIDKIDPNWSGSIPFTIIFNNKKRTFHERMFESTEDLENEIKKIN
ncbi:TlpA family protein disulfide reductase [Polaribacter sp. R2A056_3_33]|uniref:TlpA family protein disulfide reductase n=1 Tax=Polaribacter sp. R2A056_3_33 TaxID=2745563 RepID=UPI001C4FCECD|nr:TlpA disulfide reductase family protein [Polaribacter sp. R2A056_3_33]QXP70022.1 TlpA family protein disulfide reductase [Polaribacter sp. R2A056_3_33]